MSNKPGGWQGGGFRPLFYTGSGAALPGAENGGNHEKRAYTQ